MGGKLQYTTETRMGIRVSDVVPFNPHKHTQTSRSGFISWGNFLRLGAFPSCIGAGFAVLGACFQNLFSGELLQTL